MSTIHVVYVALIIFQTLMTYCSGQGRPPNWDQRFGPRPNFFEQESRNNNDNDRRNFFGNNFRPSEVFPRINPPAETNGQRPVEIPPPAGQAEPSGGVPRQVPSSTGLNPDQVGSLGGVGPDTNDQDQVSAQLPPQVGPDPGQIRPVGGMGPSFGQDETFPHQPSPEQDPMRPGMEDPLRVGQEEMAAPQQPPTGGRPIGVPTPTIPQLPVDRDRGIGLPPNPGETELMNPQLPPMARIPNPVGQGDEVDQRRLRPGNEGTIRTVRPSQIPLIPETQQPPSQPPLLPEVTPDGMQGSQLPSMSYNPGGLVPEQDMGQPGQFRGQDMLKDPGRQGAELRRQRIPMGQVRGTGLNPNGFGGPPSRQGNMNNRPPKYQTSK